VFTLLHYYWNTRHKLYTMFLTANTFRTHNNILKIGFPKLRNCYSTVAAYRKSRSDLHLTQLTKVRPTVNSVHTRTNAVRLTTDSAYRLNRALCNKYHTPRGSEVPVDGYVSYRCSCCGLNTPGN